MPRKAFNEASMSDAIATLADDHRKLLRLFEQFEIIRDDAEDSVKQTLVEILCTGLVIHAQVEEEFLYPALRGSHDGARLMDEAAVEHLVARQLIGDLEAMQPGDDLYDARVKVLGEYVRHHIEEEEKSIFPLLRDLPSGGRAGDLLARREELRSEFGMPDEDAAGLPDAGIPPADRGGDVRRPHQ